jgi:ribose transport system substrate-binding protein
MRLTETEMCGAVFLGVALLLGFSAAARADDVLSQAKAVVAAATAPASAWTGPTTGPVAATGKTVVYVAADLRNGGIQEVGDGVKQAGAKIGWTSARRAREYIRHSIRFRPGHGAQAQWDRHRWL